MFLTVEPRHPDHLDGHGEEDGLRGRVLALQVEDVDAAVRDVDEAEQEERDDDGEHELFSPILEKARKVVPETRDDGLGPAKLYEQREKRYWILDSVYK